MKRARQVYLPKSNARARLIRSLMVSASMVVGFSGVAHAQTTTAKDQTKTQQSTQSTQPAQTQGVAATQQGNDIVVTGYRQSIEASLEQKREANAFIDVITAEDVGKFPDKNVADSLQRVPGVIISRDGGEGSRVSIRGLSSDLTLTELNGNFIASADDGDPSRSFNYLLLPSNLIASVDVYKSPEARLDEGGVGGVIIMHTRKPFDLKPWSGNISVEGTYSDVTDKVEPQISGLLSWHNADKTLGFLVGATYQKRTNRSLGANTESWHWWADDPSATPATDVNGNTYSDDNAISYWGGGGTTTQDGTHYNGYWAPQSVDESVFIQQRKRLGIQATAQMRPFDNLTITANYFRFQLDGDYVNNTLKIPEWGYGNFFTNATFDPSGTILQSATFQVPADGTGCRTATADHPNPCTMETPAMQSSYSREKTVSSTYDVHGEWNVGRLDVSFKLGKTRATGGPSFQFFAQAKPRMVTGSGFDGNVNGNLLSQWSFTNQSVAMQFSPDLQQNLMNGISQVDLGSTGSGYTNSIIQQRYAQIDITRHFDSFIDSIQVGAKWRDGFVQRTTGEFDWYSDDANTLRYQDTAGAAVTQPGFFLSQPIGNIAGGFTTNVFPAFNMDNYLAYLNQTYNGPVRVPQPQNRYDINERIWAGYAQLNYKTDRLRGNIGVRFVNTKQSGVSTDVIYYEDDYCVNTNGDPFVPPPVGPDGNCLVLPQSQRERRVYSPNSEAKSYSDILPSFNISYDLTRNLLIRGEVSKVMSRPGYGDLAGSRNLTFNSDAFVYDRAQFGALPGWFGSGGNFDLKPFKAWQYDVGVEWYFHPGSVLGGTLFRKDVSDFIVPLVLDVQQQVAGQTVTIQQYSTQANGSSAVSQGVELYAQHTLPFGLGAQVNFTYNDTSVADISLNGTKVGTSPLVGSAKTQVNASVFYENSKLLLRASYNRRGEVVGGIQSGLNVYQDPYEQVDLNASYNFFKNLQLTASVINLTKSEQRSHLGNDTKDRFISNSYSGRRFYMGLSFKF
ncbi:TonB-dependent receptor [Stakelama sediminis]|uniref:TonB-dependent receptor n=1 Tax=Stakelama sediminis TaxID=463200 RepID=A0A840YXH1_9SPHN|nr:TonB-dependent receptor [Stakelama sediminis]MBB5718242.1 TonB-dependent receptor [Stakelama sediminis]